MKKLLFTLIILSVFVGSCKTEKRITKSENHETTDSTVIRDVNVSEIMQQQNNVDSKLSDLNQITDHSTAVITITEYSKPDSAGNQHIDKQTVVDQHNDIEQNSKTISDKSESTITELRKDSSDNSQIDLSQKSDNKTAINEKSKFPVWVIVAGVCFIIGLAGLVYLKIRKLI